MKIEVKDITGKQIEEISLNKNVFGVELNRPLLAQYIRVFKSNQRQGTSSTLTRGEVSGGGKKPWKQKGTGRARVGSSRNPIWRHGGISHGPQPKDWALSLPKKMRVLAIKMALSSKYADKKMHIVNAIEMNEPKTKTLTEMLNSLKLKGTTLLVMDTKNDSILKSVSNIKHLKTALSSNLNGYELLESKNVVFVKEAVKKLEDKYKA